jgi:hypothetical protein
MRGKETGMNTRTPANFTTLFGGTESLQNFWQNFALMK